jgi:hypothetical protein
MRLEIIKTDSYLLGVDKEAILHDEDIHISPIREGIMNTFIIDNKVGNDNYKSRPLDRKDCWKVIAHIPLNGNKSLEGVPLLPDFELEEDFWENMPVRWVKWTRKKPDWNGSVYMQFNGKNQGNGLVHNKELIKLSGLANSEFKNYEDTFYWLEQDFNYYKAYNAAGGYTEEDMKKAFMQGMKGEGCTALYIHFEEFIQSLKPFPIEFEVEMEEYGYEPVIGKFPNYEVNPNPKLFRPKILNNIIQGKYIWKQLN